MTHILVLTANRPRDGFPLMRLAARAIEALSARFPGADVAVRDLAQSPLPQATGFFADDPVLGGRKPGTSRDANMPQPDELIDELLAADILVIAVPMLDHSIPSSLKSWIDHVTRRGRTFRYTEGLPQGLVTGKKAVIVRQASGHAGARPGPDYQAPYLRQMLGFLGMSDIEVIDIDVNSGGPASGEAAGQGGAMWSRAGGLAASDKPPVMMMGSTPDAVPSPRRAGVEWHHPSPSLEWIGAPAAKTTRLKSPWR
jgi:FMN-dependent NADH-azoreductase